MAANSANRSVDQVIAEHEDSGRRFDAGGISSFTLDQGDGDPVVCFHGVPVSSFLYRRVVPLLAERGLRGIAFDLPGLGLADRPGDFDYSWSGLAAWSGDAIDALGIERCHLVVHDIGGPVGLEWAVRNPERVLSLTVLDTLIEVEDFKPPWSMRPFRSPVLGPLWLGAMTRFALVQLFYLQGIADRDAVPAVEIGAHYDLLKRGDRGRAFLRIMRGFELTAEKEQLLVSGLRARTYPAAIVWGRRDPALGLDRLESAKSVLGVDEATLLDAKHFVPEDHPAEVAEAVAALAAGASA